MARQRKFKSTDLFDIGIKFQLLQAYYRNQPVDDPDTKFTGDPVIDPLQRIIGLILPLEDRGDESIENLENELLEEYFEAYEDSEPDSGCRSLYAVIFQTINRAPILLLPRGEFAHDHLIDSKKQERIFRQLNGDRHRILIRLPPYARRDFREAFRCYAHGLYYASETLLWRAVEETVRTYYGKATNKEDTRKPSWYDIIEELKSVLLTDSEKLLLDRIDKARELRNEVAHSGNVSERSAKNALRESIQIVTSIVEDLERRGLLESGVVS